MANLQTAREHYTRQKSITLASVKAAHRARRTERPARVAAAITAGQALAVAEAEAAIPRMLEEQGIDAPPQALLATSALVGASSYLGTIADSVTALWEATEAAFARMVASELQDVGRRATQIGTAVRPNVTGHVRYLQLPSCAPCAILAGRVYRWSDGFERHPNCDCVMLPTNREQGRQLVSDPMDAYRSGMLHKLTEADREAIDAGADLAQVVNVRSKKAGLTRAGRVWDRGGRPTPEAIFQLASDRDDALRLLEQHGYIR